MKLLAEKVNKSYGREHILKDINVTISKGEILGIVGESGCGKSTLARVLCCYEKPSSGRILLSGEDTAVYSRTQRENFHRCCQLILQDNLFSLDPLMRIGDTLHETLKYNGCPNKKMRQEKIEAYLGTVMLTLELLEQFPAQLSGGERQRINICRALLVEPELVMCDEITSSLDVITQYHLLEVLKHINKEAGLSLLFISHDINAVKSISDRILVMHEGRIVEELQKADHFAYSNRYTKWLLESLPIDHPSKRKTLATHFDEQLFSDGDNFAH